MPKKRRANGRNKPAGARGHVSTPPHAPFSGEQPPLAISRVWE